MKPEQHELSVLFAVRRPIVGGEKENSDCEMNLVQLLLPEAVLIRGTERPRCSPLT